MRVSFSHRSPIYSKDGIVSSSQCMASQAGCEILKKGGNAADAAVATAAALAVTQPTSNGIGGDAFCLFYDSKTQSVHALNGSGRSSASATREECAKRGVDVETGESLPPRSALCITVPGACAAWFDTLERFGSGNVTMADVLAPAIRLAEHGFVVQQKTALLWKRQEDLLRRMGATELLVDGERAPRAGELFYSPGYARTLRAVGKNGKAGFYSGEVGDAIVRAVVKHGGLVDADDLVAHMNESRALGDVRPISVEYHGYRVWTCAPNGQGITALMALSILKNVELGGMARYSTRCLHYMLEAMRLAFADARQHVADAAHMKVSSASLLDTEYARGRFDLIDEKCARADIVAGSPQHSSDTVYLSVIDGDGNGCSFIQSNYEGFGTGIVPEGFGFTLQNRGANFCLQEGHVNVIGPRKRPYHTIIPGMITRDGDSSLFAVFGNMGGFMQPSGLVQHAVNMIDFGMNAQETIDAPRFCLLSGESASAIAIERGDNGEIDEQTLEELRSMGHCMEATYRHGAERLVFGNAQIVVRDESGILCGGTDSRIDGVCLSI